MSAVLERLGKAIDSPTHQHDGWHAYELCYGLANLAKDFDNLKIAVSAIYQTGSSVIVKKCIWWKNRNHQKD